MRRPPLVVVFVALLVIALGETAGALMSQWRPQIVPYAQARVAANPQAHGLAGSAEYDGEITARAVYSAEAGVSFFHTHAQGLGPLVIFAGSVVAGVVPWRRARGALYALFGLGAFFPLGYLAYAVMVLERGRDAGVELAERYVLMPLGSAAIVGLVALALLMVAGARLILMDEPTQGLAPGLIRHIRDMIRELKRLRITVLLVEQNARVALSVCDRGYIMEKGSIVFEGPSAELRESPVTREKLGV